MIKPTLIFDLDNTIIDNSVRKHEIINRHLNLTSVSLGDIRNDYSLKSFLGEYDTVVYKKFFAELSSENGITNYKSELYPDSFDVLTDLHRIGFRLIILTSRPEKLRNATEQEFEFFDVSRYEN